MRKISFRHAATSDMVGVKLSGQYFSGTDWEHEDPEEVRLRGRNPRDYDTSRISGELRLDVRPTEDFTGIFSTGFARINSIEMTGIGAGQADGWANYFVQGRVLFKDVFLQAFHNASDAGDTKLLRTNDPIVDTSSFTVLQAQHSLSVADRGRITYGVDGLFTRPNTDGTITGSNETRDDIDEFGAYVQGEINLNEQVTLLGAARLDDHNHVDERVFSPRGAVVVKPDPLQTFRLTYNRAFSTPSTSNFFLDLVQARDAFGTGSRLSAGSWIQPQFRRPRAGQREWIYMEPRRRRRSHFPVAVRPGDRPLAVTPDRDERREVQQRHVESRSKRGYGRGPSFAEATCNRFDYRATHGRRGPGGTDSRPGCRAGGGVGGRLSEYHTADPSRPPEHTHGSESIDLGLRPGSGSGRFHNTRHRQDPPRRSPKPMNWVTRVSSGIASPCRPTCTAPAPTTSWRRCGWKRLTYSWIPPRSRPRFPPLSRKPCRTPPRRFWPQRSASSICRNRAATETTHPLTRSHVSSWPAQITTARHLSPSAPFHPCKLPIPTRSCWPIVTSATWISTASTSALPITPTKPGPSRAATPTSTRIYSKTWPALRISR